MNILGKEMPENIVPFYNAIKNQVKSTVIIADSKGQGSSTCSRGFSYIIKLDIQLPDDYFWEILLHEYLHILQTQIGYRDFVPKDNSFLTILTNNAIMDIDVDRRLKELGFNAFSLQRRNQILFETALMINNYQLNGFSEDNIKTLAVSIAYIKIVYGDEFIDILEDAAQRLSKDFIKYYNSFINVVRSHPQTTYMSVQKIQNQLIRILKIKNYEFE